MTLPTLRIATRASNLALWQANHVAERLRAAHAGLVVNLVEISTQGDRDLQESLRAFGGLGVFTREVQKAVLDRRADLAVHSLKDLPTAAVEGLQLAAVPERATVFDAFVAPQNSELKSLEQLPAGARVGTGSPRRQAQLWHRRPDLQLLEVRGNVETRLRKLDEGQYDALVLAEAGLSRLGYTDRITTVLTPPTVYPAVSQGALGIECRADDAETAGLLAAISDPITFARVTAERALLAELRAGCHAPLGAMTEVHDDVLGLAAVILSLDGTQRIELAQRGPLSEPESLGRNLAEQFRAAGAETLLENRPS